jgi:hypothetical protein
VKSGSQLQVHVDVIQQWDYHLLLHHQAQANVNAQVVKNLLILPLMHAHVMPQNTGHGIGQTLLQHVHVLEELHSQLIKPPLQVASHQLLLPQPQQTELGTSP